VYIEIKYIFLVFGVYALVHGLLLDVTKEPKPGYLEPKVYRLQLLFGSAISLISSVLLTFAKIQPIELSASSIGEFVHVRINSIFLLLTSSTTIMVGVYYILFRPRMGYKNHRSSNFEDDNRSSLKFGVKLTIFGLLFLCLIIYGLFFL